jgi:L-arabinose isomerase
VSVFVPYSDLWAEVVQHDIAAERRAFTAEIAEVLRRDADVVLARAFSSSPDGAAAGREAAALDPHVVLVIQTMGTQPAFTLAALDQLSGLPVVVWWAQTMETSTSSFDHAADVAEGGAVGTPMLTNMLVRRRTSFQLVEGHYASTETIAEVGEVLSIAGAAARLRRARIGRVGFPIDGYACVDADETSLRESLVGEFIHIEPSEVRQRFLDVDEESIALLAASVRTSFDVATTVETDGFERSIRFAVAIRQLCNDHELDGGIMNCHVPELRFNADVGVTPCFGLGVSTTAGIPWTCAGDMLTIVPMLSLKLLGEGGVYHELEARDPSTLEFVIANTGEHDLAMAGDERPSVVRNDWFAGDPRCGVCACYSLRPGPAALVGFTQIGTSHRFIVARGAITGRGWPNVGTVNGAFTFESGRPGWIRWCEAGVNHHSALTSATAVSKLERLCRLLDVELVVV